VLTLEGARVLAVYFAAMIPVFSILSLPPGPPTMWAAKTLPPLLVALAGSAAAAIAAVFDHRFVRRAFELKRLAELKQKPLFGKAERYAKVAPFATILTFAALPLPFIVVRVLMPLTGYPLGRYVLATALGRFPRVFVVALVGQALDLPNWLLASLLGLGLASAALGAWLRSRRARRAASAGEASPDDAAPR
jgi:uncharacterized membrane protein YdjX (TVP38/TMEM64 family)